LKGQWQYIWDRRAGRATQDANGQGRGQGPGYEASGIQARSIQALQQATSLLSEITGAMAPIPGPEGSEIPANAGNNFGGASYGGRHVHFQQGLPPTSCRGPRNMFKVKSGMRREIGSASTHRTKMCLTPNKLESVRWTAMQTLAALAPILSQSIISCRCLSPSPCTYASSNVLLCLP